MKNLFIAIEGTDGSGKSTQAALLAEKLQQEGHKVHLTFEPTNGHIGRLLRSILKGQISVDQKAIAALFLADRLDHILNDQDGLVKKMTEGYTVISDRYYFSSFAYHSVYMNMDWVIECNQMCRKILKPDVTVFVDVPPEVCMGRIIANREVPELYETGEILRKVRNNYLEAFNVLEPEEVVKIVNGNQPVEEVARFVRDACNM